MKQNSEFSPLPLSYGRNPTSHKSVELFLIVRKKISLLLELEARYDRDSPADKKAGRAEEKGETGDQSLGENKLLLQKNSFPPGYGTGDMSHASPLFLFDPFDIV